MPQKGDTSTAERARQGGATKHTGTSVSSPRGCQHAGGCAVRHAAQSLQQAQAVLWGAEKTGSTLVLGCDTRTRPRAQPGVAIARLTGACAQRAHSRVGCGARRLQGCLRATDRQHWKSDRERSPPQQPWCLRYSPSSSSSPLPLGKPPWSPIFPAASARAPPPRSAATAVAGCHTAHKGAGAPSGLFDSIVEQRQLNGFEWFEREDHNWPVLRLLPSPLRWLFPLSVAESVSMADTVAYLLEEMVPELEDFERRGLFTRAEIKRIVAARTQHEYAMKRRAPVKADFLRAIQVGAQAVSAAAAPSRARSPAVRGEAGGAAASPQASAERGSRG